MATFTSSRTTPTDIAIRLHEVEAVLKGVLDKLADLTAPENPDLTEVNESLNRLYRTVALHAKTNNATSDPRAETIYDTQDTSVSAVLYGLVEGTAKDRVETGRPVVEATFGPDDMRFFRGSASLAVATWGYYSAESGVDYVTPVWTASASLAGLTFGSSSMLDAIIGDSFVSSGNSIAYKAFGSPGMVTALGSKSLAAITFGGTTLAAAWAGSLKSLAEGCFGSDVPGLTESSLVDRIASLESRMSSAESRLSAGGL